MLCPTRLDAGLRSLASRPSNSRRPPEKRPPPRPKMSSQGLSLWDLLPRASGALLPCLPSLQPPSPPSPPRPRLPRSPLQARPPARVAVPTRGCAHHLPPLRLVPRTSSPHRPWPLSRPPNGLAVLALLARPRGRCPLSLLRAPKVSGLDWVLVRPSGARNQCPHPLLRRHLCLSLTRLRLRPGRATRLAHA